MKLPCLTKSNITLSTRFLKWLGDINKRKCTHGAGVSSVRTTKIMIYKLKQTKININIKPHIFNGI